MSLTGEIEHLRQEWQDALGYLLGYIDEEQWEDAIVSYGDASIGDDYIVFNWDQVTNIEKL